jgi:hypothetical protein
MKIAVICAYSGGLNAGMLSVDWAFDSVRSRLGPDAGVDFFFAEQELDLALGDRRMHYQLLQNQNQLAGFDSIVYWGDFLHWIGYATLDWLGRWKKRNTGRSDDDIINSWYQLMLLEGAPELQRRVIIFGGTLYGVEARQLTNTRYRSALENLYSNARLVLMRDIRSANVVSQLAPNRPPAFGCDCALLLDSALTSSEAAEESAKTVHQNPTAQQIQGSLPERYMLCSFGRSNANLALDAFSHFLATTMGLPKVTLHWLDGSGTTSFVQKLEVLRGATCVVTDIYHLAVSAMREHTPVLGLGRGASYAQNSLSDKKKEIFFAQSMASANFVFVEAVLESLHSDQLTQELSKRCASALDDSAANHLIFECIERQKERAFGLLVSSLLSSQP